MAGYENDDLEAMIQPFDEEAECARVSPLLDPVIYYGPAGLLQLAADWIESFGEFDQRAEEFIDAGDEVLIQMLLTGRGEASGIAVTGTYWYRYTLRNGKIVGFHIHGSREQALEAARVRN